MRKLYYAKRILQLNENNWTRLIFEYIIQQDICTKWRKEILNLRINMEINNNESLWSQILGWHEKEWIKEVEEKSTLKYYNKNGQEKLKISDRLCLLSGHQTINEDNIRKEIQNIKKMKVKLLEFGELIIKLKKEWETKNRVQGGSLGVDHH